MEIQIRDRRNGQWFWIHQKVIKEYGFLIGPVGIAVYNCLASHVNRKGYCFPSQQTIADEIGSSLAQVKRALVIIKKHKLISQKFKGGCVCIYYLNKI